MGQIARGLYKVAALPRLSVPGLKEWTQSLNRVLGPGRPGAWHGSPVRLGLIDKLRLSFKGLLNSLGLISPTTVENDIRNTILKMFRSKASPKELSAINRAMRQGKFPPFNV